MLQLFKRKGSEQDKNLSTENLKEESSVNPKGYLNVTEEDLENYSMPCNNHLKVKHFTHTDIAGKTCAILGKRTFKNIDTEYISNSDALDRISGSIFIDADYTKYDLILISDLVISDAMLETMDNIMKQPQCKSKILFVNHLANAYKDTDKKEWMFIESTHNDIKQDSANVLFRLLEKDFGLIPDEWLLTLLEKSRRYTTWEWVKLNDKEADDISTICTDYGHDYFVTKLIKKHISNCGFLDEDDMSKINFLDEKYEAYKQLKIDQTILQRVGETRVAFVYAEQYINRLGDDIMKKFNNVDHVVIINSFTNLHIRASQNSKRPASDLAQVFGGNGKSKAAGATVPVSLREDIVRFLIAKSQEETL